MSALLDKLGMITLTAREKQKVLEELCSMPEPEFRKCFEAVTGNVFCFHCDYRKDTTGNGHICGYDGNNLLMPEDGYCRYGIRKQV